MNQPNDSTTSTTPITSTPRLWNPNAAACWSLFLSPVFGAVLQMKNWEAMGESEKARQSKKWAVGSAAVLVVAVFISGMLPDNKALDLLARAVGFALLLSWYYSSGKQQSAAVFVRYGKSYPRRGWVKPLLYGILAFAGFVLGVSVIGVALGAIIGSN